MLKNLKFLFFSLIFLFITANSFANNKIAIIDLDYLIQNSNSGKLILDNLNKLDKQNIELLKKKSEELAKLENETKNKQKIISKEAYNKEILLLRNKIDDFRKEKNLLVNKFSEYRDKELSNFFNKISPIIKNYMDENSIGILLDKKKIFMGNSNVDITNEILIIINSETN
ncbi:OmpH family outer membrane protein [Candidatus Pelagibacter communis]|uniref:OmpH family outer membrane protein n=1 Tax=Pelagibacter ubique TaxID=198252 RepID=UPI00065B3845|nr:OmpH family outer membrane protein [Candidatus Pelagibacter ubique]